MQTRDGVAVWAAMILAGCTTAQVAPHLTVPMRLVSDAGVGSEIGKITLEESRDGVRMRVRLSGLTPGDHGMHLHANPSCEASIAPDGGATPAGAAGAHYDPSGAHRHAGPMGDGHLGDLPLIRVDARGAAQEMLIVPRIHDVAQFKGHAIVIHANGDNYSDTPAPLGGGGARIACGVVE